MKRLLGIAILCAMISMTACGNTSVESSNASEIEENITEEITTEAIATEPEHGTSAYVDYLAFKAKDDAETASNEQLQEAVDWLKNNTAAYFSTEENMEKTMYYGQLLEYKYKGTENEYEKIGWQAFKTVKYVYRGAESVSDDVTQNNLLELQEMAENLPDIQ